RVVVEPYEPVMVTKWRIDPNDPGVSLAEVAFHPRPGERTVSVSLDDEAGWPVRGSIEQEGNYVGPFCGETEKPMPIEPGKDVWVVVYSGVCDGSATVATSGTIEVTFFRGSRR
ncbi:MAG: hypothetical protein ABR613_09925, partial [Actinomycetota bacterium]